MKPEFIRENKTIIFGVHLSFFGRLIGSEKLDLVMERWDLEMGVSKNSGTPKSSILIGFSIIYHLFWGTPIFGNTLIDSNKKLAAFDEPQLQVRILIPNYIQ